MELQNPSTQDYALATAGHTLASIVSATFGTAIGAITIANFPDGHNVPPEFYNTALLGSMVGFMASGTGIMIAGYSAINAICRGFQTISSFLSRE